MINMELVVSHCDSLMLHSTGFLKTNLVLTHNIQTKRYKYFIVPPNVFNGSILYTKTYILHYKINQPPFKNIDNP